MTARRIELRRKHFALKGTARLIAIAVTFLQTLSEIKVTNGNGTTNDKWYVLRDLSPAGARGRAMFRTNCTTCHNVSQGKAVPARFD